MSRTTPKPLGLRTAPKQSVSGGPGGGEAVPPSGGAGGSFLVLEPPISSNQAGISAQVGTGNYIPDP